MTLILLICMVIGLATFSIYRYVLARNVAKLHEHVAAGTRFLQSSKVTNPFIKADDLFEVTAITDDWVQYRRPHWSDGCNMTSTVSDFLYLYSPYELKEPKVPHQH